MFNAVPIPYESPCPKCGLNIVLGGEYCQRIKECQTWKTFGGEHLHVMCQFCKFVRTMRCKDAEQDDEVSFEDINRTIDKLVEESNTMGDLEND